MATSTLGIGLGNVGMMGQQPWQRLAQTNLYNQKYAEYLARAAQSQGGLRYAAPMQQTGASIYAEQFKSGGPLAGVATPMPASPFAGNWWNQYGGLNFPF